MKSKLDKFTGQFEKATDRLREALKKEKDEFIKDSAIKRFEICYELCWKLIKAYLENEGIDCISPRDCFRKAFSQKIIKYEKQWLGMIEDRNATSHLYNEDVAEEIYSRLNDYLGLYQDLLKRVKKVF